MSPAAFDKVSSEIERRKPEFIERLRAAVAIPSVSADPEHREDVFRMIKWARQLLEKLGAQCEEIENGIQTLDNGKTLKLPPVLFATLGKDPQKKTLLVYGHLDVQPAHKSDGWHTEPFELVEKDEKLYGRGSTDDKGPIVAWLNAIETMQSLKVDLPVNIKLTQEMNTSNLSGGSNTEPKRKRSYNNHNSHNKFVLEGMEESGSEGLDDILERHKDSFLKDVDFTCISDNYWLGRSKPCITYGLRGICYYAVEIKGPKQDLHSGVFGNTIHEPLSDLVWILGQLASVDGQILIEGISDIVAPVTAEEHAVYESIDFSMDDYKEEIGVKQLVTESKKELLMNRWRFPSLSVHGIEGAFSGPGSKTVIPAKVTGKFSIRLVPNMEPEKVDELVFEYLNKLWAQRGSSNTMKPVSLSGARPWVADFKHPNYQAAARAIEQVFGVEPDFTREGCSIPVTLTFQELTQKNVMLLPIGASDDMAHSQNEKINVGNYIQGTKTMAAYLLELGQL